MAAGEPPDRQALRLHRRPLRGPDRLHVLLVGLRRRGAEGEGRQQAAAARAAADPARPDPRRRRHRASPARSPKGRATPGATCAATRRALSTATRSATASCDEGDSEFEQFHNDELVGNDSEFASILDELRGKQQEGNDIVTNIDPEAQESGAGRARGGRASAPWSRSSRAPAGSRCWPRTRPTTRTGSPTELHRAEPRTKLEAPLRQPRHPGPLPAGLDLQGGDRRRGARQRRRSRRTRRSTRRARSTSRASRSKTTSATTSRARSARHGADQLGQHLVRPARRTGRPGHALRIHGPLRLQLDAGDRPARRRRSSPAASSTRRRTSCSAATTRSTSPASRSARSGCW